MLERIIIVGAGVMQGPAINIARELGFCTVAVDGNAAAPCAGMADQFEQIDLKDKEGIETFARSLYNSGGLGGIVTAGTDFSATVAWVAERLGLPGIPYEAALNASDKARMRACFTQAGLPSPAFITVTASDNAASAMEFSLRENSNGFAAGKAAVTVTDLPAPFPLVVKPVDNMGGRGCRRVDSMPELEEAVADALRFSRSGRAIVEAFIPGPEFSVDAIVYHGEITICGLADRHIFFPPYFIEMGHTMPTAIAPEQQEALLETFRAGIRALGLAGPKSVGAAKGDIKLSPAGPQIGEIAARLSGGYMSGWTYPYSSGVRPIRAAILAAMGRKPDGLVPPKTWTSVERAFISIPGTVQAISGTKTAQSIPRVQDMFLRITKGDKVSFPENNVTKCGNIISAAPERQSAIEAAENAARAVLIRLDPADPATEQFLSRSGAEAAPGFPPDAFTPGPEIRARLAALPETVIGPENGIRVIAFPEFTESALKDYTGRSVAESLQAIRQLTGLSLPEIPQEYAEFSDNKDTLLGRSFWEAFIRGGYQGAVYFIDRI